MTVTTITIPRMTIHPTDWLTSNGSHGHWSTVRAARHRLRHRAAIEARGWQLQPITGPVHVTVHVGYPTRTKADPINAAPTVKPIIDGIVDARILPEDNSDVITAITYVRDTELAPRGTHTIRIDITHDRSNADATPTTR